jgi:hypothetical protein
MFGADGSFWCESLADKNSGASKMSILMTRFDKIRILRCGLKTVVNIDIGYIVKVFEAFDPKHEAADLSTQALHSLLYSRA